jgi:DNA-binding transcriptional MerR regulator
LDEKAFDTTHQEPPLIKSKRLDGKNRYFSSEDLKRNKTNRPLSISEVSKKLNISPTTLRRLESRGVITPSRNKAGERIFDSSTIETFLKSEYFQRKKNTIRKQKPLPKKEEPVSQVLKEDTKSEPNSDLSSEQKTRPFLANFVAISTATFLLLLTVGLGNIFLFKTQNYEVLPLSMVLGEKITATTPLSIPAPIETEHEQTSSMEQVQIQEPETALEKYLAQSLKMINEEKEYKKSFNSDYLRLVEIATDSGVIRQQPDILSPIVGSPSTGEVFQFLSFDSGWVGLKLHESTQSGFIQEQYVQVKEFEFSVPESGSNNANESTNSALMEQSDVKEGTNDQSIH